MNLVMQKISNLFDTEHYELNENELNVAEELLNLSYIMTNHLLTQLMSQLIFYLNMQVNMSKFVLEEMWR